MSKPAKPPDEQVSAHELLAVPALLRRIAKVLPLDVDADRQLNAYLSTVYADFPIRKIQRK